MVPGAEAGQEEPRERDKLALEVEPEIKKIRKKTLRFQGSFYLSLIPCLSQFILKFYFFRGNFRLLIMLGSLKIPIEISVSLSETLSVSQPTKWLVHLVREF